MSVYSNLEIKHAIEKGSIVSVPFSPEHLNRTSLDVTLGYYYYRVSGQYEKSIYDLFNKEDVEGYFDGPHRALTHEEWCSANGHKPVDNIPLNHPVISIEPKERVLAHTHEFLGVLSPSAAEVRSRASWSRNGVIISLGSGWIEPNQVSRHTLELYNSNERETLLLPVGERIAQVIFWHKARNGVDEASVASCWSVDLETATNEWSPEQLLPRAYADERVLPIHVQDASYD